MNSQSKPTILVINDEPDALDLTAFILTRAGYNVLAANNGRTGLETAKQAIPDLVISDVMMPDINGIELCRLLRAEIRLKTTPLILVSAIHKDSQTAVEGLEAGADDYIEVPFEPERLVAKVARLLERKQSEHLLRESEERSRILIESATEYAIFSITPDGLVASWNTGAERIFGYKENEIIGQPAEILFTPEDREKGIHQKEMDIARKEGRAEDERWHIRQDGSRFYASGLMMTLKEGTEGFVKIARDQTKKLEAEKTQREKEMLVKLVHTQEDERKRIARDLHDELGQQLTALRLKLEQIRKLCENDDELSAKVDDAQTIAKHIDDGVDFLAWELRPSVLDDLGLIAALDKYVKEWSHYAGVTAEFISSGNKRMRLASEVEINLYRIVQEALNNTYKYAKADRAGVTIDKRDGLIVLIIEDNGVGFNPKHNKNRSKGLGLIGIEERAALINGTVEIESALKKGTTIYVRIPANL
jgi:PAS domain S-box-containing protein